MDSDLAILYNCTNGTKDINKAVNRNVDKFPEDFYFQLSLQEYENLKFQNGTSRLKHGGLRKLPHVFTEQGVAMLATVLKTSTAAIVSIRIMRTFVAMRHYLLKNKDIYKSLNDINHRLYNQETKLLEHDDKFEILFSKFDKKEQLLLQGKTYDAYSNILDILENANNELIIIDSYADKSFLDLIRNFKSNVILITRNSNRLSNLEIDKYNKQYNNLKVIRDNSFHDRYFFIDRKKIYLCGSSINSLGDKTSMIIKLEDNVVKNTLLKNIEEIINK